MKLPVLCCNDPYKVLGYLPEGRQIRTREFEEPGQYQNQEIDESIDYPVIFSGQLVATDDWKFGYIETWNFQHDGTQYQAHVPYIVSSISSREEMITRSTVLYRRVPLIGRAYIAEELEYHEWLELEGFEPRPEIYHRMALEYGQDARHELREGRPQNAEHLVKSCLKYVSLAQALCRKGELE